MAIVARIHIGPAQQDDHDRLERAVEARMQEAGGPPDGLLVHIGLPTGTGFEIVEAWRTHDLFQSYLDSVFLPAVREVGLGHHEPELSPAWSIARP